jgi:hypothetical protein
MVHNTDCRNLPQFITQPYINQHMVHDTDCRHFHRAVNKPSIIDITPTAAIRGWSVLDVTTAASCSGDCSWPAHQTATSKTNRHVKPQYGSQQSQLSPFENEPWLPDTVSLSMGDTVGRCRLTLSNPSRNRLELSA